MQLVSPFRNYTPSACTSASLFRKFGDVFFLIPPYTRCVSLLHMSTISCRDTPEPRVSSEADSDTIQLVIDSRPRHHSRANRVCGRDEVSTPSKTPSLDDPERREVLWSTRSVSARRLSEVLREVER